MHLYDSPEHSVEMDQYSSAYTHFICNIYLLPRNSQTADYVTLLPVLFDNSIHHFIMVGGFLGDQTPYYSKGNELGLVKPPQTFLPIFFK